MSQVKQAKTHRMGFRLPETELVAVKTLADDRGLTLTDVIRAAIAAYVEQQQKTPVA